MQFSEPVAGITNGHIYEVSGSTSRPGATECAWYFSHIQKAASTELPSAPTYDHRTALRPVPIVPLSELEEKDNSRKYSLRVANHAFLCMFCILQCDF